MSNIIYPRKNSLYLTKRVTLLQEALMKRGIKSVAEYPDGHKHVDIAILQAGIYIEVDGLQHFTNAKQIQTDFKRSYWSTINDDVATMHIPNIIIDNYLEQVADAIAKVVEEKIKHKK